MPKLSLRDQLKRLKEKNRELRYQLNFLQDLMWVQNGGVILPEPPKRKEEPIGKTDNDQFLKNLFSYSEEP